MSIQKQVTTASAEDQLKQKAVKRAKNYTDAVICSALTIDTLHHDNLDIPTVVSTLTQSVSEVQSGNIQEIEAMLLTQAHTLNTLFHKSLSQVTQINMINQIQVFSDIALRAQNQARKTLAVLAELKNPRRTTFINQQNNAINQQVNTTPKNGLSKNYKNSANELVSEVPHETLDARGTGTAISNNTPSEALATLHRAADTEG